MGFISNLIAQVIEYIVAKFIKEEVVDLEIRSSSKTDAENLAKAKPGEDSALKEIINHTFPDDGKL